MADRSRPWSKFYWSDWESDIALRQCSLAAQGLWMRLLCICAKAETRGYLAIGDVHLDVAAIATAVSKPETEVACLLEELERWGVFSRDRKGRIYSRRMVRDEKRSKDGRKFKKEALSEGSQVVEKECKNPVPSRGAARGPSPHKPEARSQNRKTTTTNDPGPIARAEEPARRVAAAFEKIRDEFWPNAMPPANRMTLEAEAAQFLAMGGTVDVLEATLRSGMTATANSGKSPPSSLKAYRLSLHDAAVGMKPRHEQDAQTASCGEDPARTKWRQRLGRFAKTGFWSDEWGAKPGEAEKPGQFPCQAPADLVKEISVAGKVSA